MSSAVEDRTASWVVDQQFQSPLYVSLPPEIRLHIFKFAVEEHYDNPVQYKPRARHGHGIHPDDDGALESSVEPACFTNSGQEDESDNED